MHSTCITSCDLLHNSDDGALELLTSVCIYYVDVLTNSVTYCIYYFKWPGIVASNFQ